MINEMVEMFKTDLTNVFNREGKEAGFLNAKDFDSNIERVSAGVHIATKRAIKFGALKAAAHRQESHGDDNLIEQQFLRSSLSEEDNQKVKASGSGWRN